MSEKSTKNGIGDLSREADRNLPDFDQTHIAKRPRIAARPCAVGCQGQNRPLGTRRRTESDQLTGCGPLADLIDRGGGAATDDDGQ